MRFDLGRLTKWKKGQDADSAEGLENLRRGRDKGWGLRGDRVGWIATNGLSRGLMQFDSCL